MARAFHPFAHLATDGGIRRCDARSDDQHREARVLLAWSKMVTAGDQKLANPDALFAACDGDERIYDRIRTSLARAIPQELAHAVSHLDREDLAALREVAHKLHGMLGTASSTVAVVASTLEDHAEAGALDACKADLTSLQQLIPRLLAELSALSFEQLAP